MRSALVPWVGLLAVLLAAPSAAARPGPADDLDGLFREYDRWMRESFPEQAMRRGDYRNADRLTDHGLEAIEQRHHDRIRFLTRLRLVSYDDLDEPSQLDYDLFERMLVNETDEHAFRTFLAPLAARSGPHQEISRLAEGVRFERVEDYANYVSRLEQVPRLVDQTIDLLRRGIDEGRVPPAVVVRGVPEQIEALLAGGLESLARPLAAMPERFTDTHRTTLERRFEDTALPAVRGALARLEGFVVDVYLPACRESVAAADWPEGEAWYAHRLRVMTTIDLSPGEVYALGQVEVERIRAEMLAVIRSTDFMDRFEQPDDVPDDETLFGLFVEHLHTDARFYHDTADELIAGYRAICKEVDGHLPRFFDRLPRLPYGVRAVPDFMAPHQTTAYYERGDRRNHEAGFFYANTYALDQRPTYEMTALALHEAVPGHHLQIALALELEDLPEFRKEAWFTAYGEGWALYAERLGLEMGLYEDPYDDFGRLLYEMWRACRLVVDPGLHVMGWSREQAIQFMAENTALSELNIRNEVDRYIAWPGQATAYKIGELRIRDLRRRAEERLGDGFDLREFHDVVLESGSVPLDVLERRVTRWIDRSRMAGVLYD